MARAALKWGVRDVAKAAKVSPATVTRIESDASANASTLSAIRAALEAAGVIFIDQNGEGPGVRLRKIPPGGSKFVYDDASGLTVFPPDDE